MSDASLAKQSAWSEHRAWSNSMLIATQQEWLKQLPTDFRTIIDVGCGAGYHSLYFQELGFDVTAMDIDLSAFLFRDKIRAIEGGIFEDGIGTYDAVLCSHVLEHFPDTQRALRRLRQLLKPNGYLFIAVPAYAPIAAGEHFNIGWNVAQLGGWLVSTGFDCREGIFAKLAGQICGFGRASDQVPIADYVFSLERTMQFMPAPLKNMHFLLNGTDNLMHANIRWLDQTTLIQEETNVCQAPIPAFSVVRTLYSTSEPFSLSDGWNDRLASFPDARDLSNSTITIICLVEGKEPCALRLCVAGDPIERDNADYWNQYPPGVSIVQVPRWGFTERNGATPWHAIRNIAFGGYKSPTESVRFAILAEDGSILLHT